VKKSARATIGLISAVVGFSAIGGGVAPAFAPSISDLLPANSVVNAEPAAEPTPDVAPAPESTPAFAWTTTVSNSGEQAEIDLCAGGLTLMNSVSDWLNRPYYPIHHDCGGKPILYLELGDLVQIDNIAYRVVDSKDVLEDVHADAFADIAGDAIIQTCYPWEKNVDGQILMRAVGLEKLTELA